MENKIDKIGQAIIIFVIICIVLGLWYLIENFTYITYNSQLNEVCTDYGYEKVTDSRFTYLKEHSGQRKILIECDNILVKKRNNNYWNNYWFEFKQIGSEWCASYDKWGSCEYYNNNFTTIILH